MKNEAAKIKEMMDCVQKAKDKLNNPILNDASRNVLNGFIDLITPKWVAAPPDFICPDCGAPLERLQISMGGPWSGSVRCTKCKFCDTVPNYLAKKCISVVPMDKPADQPAGQIIKFGQPANK